MKNLLLVLPLAALSLGLSSCCSMFGVSMPMYSTEKVRACCRTTTCQPAQAPEGRIVKVHTSGSGFRLGQYQLEDAANPQRKAQQEAELARESQPTRGQQRAYYTPAPTTAQSGGYTYSGGSKDAKAVVEQPAPQAVKQVCYKTVTRIHYNGPCVRPFCPDKVCCGTTGPRTRQLATVQSATGAPNLGLIPTMKPLAP